MAAAFARRRHTTSRSPSASRERHGTHGTHGTAVAVVDQQRRVAAAALTPNTCRDYHKSAWSAWERWAAEHGRQTLRDAPGSSRRHGRSTLEAHHADGTSPATVHTARADVAMV